MKKKRFVLEQIIEILRQAAVGVPAVDTMPSRCSFATESGKRHEQAIGHRALAAGATGGGTGSGISGLSTNMEDDFVELPSQMLEEWMRDPHVLASFARNYKTGEPIPDSLVEQMNRASTFGRATDVSTQIATAANSYDLYKENPDKIKPDQVVLGNIRRYTLLSPIPADAYSYAAFSHLANHSSGFYTYLWDKVIAEDFFQQFDQKNLLGADTPLRYRRQVLEPGGSKSANDLVKGFLGRTPQTEAFWRWMNEEFENPPTKKQP